MNRRRSATCRRSVNTGRFARLIIIEFPINGVETTMGPGMFSSNPGLVTVGDVLVPNRYYARIYCADGNVLYTSNVIEAPGGLTDAYLTFRLHAVQRRADHSGMVADAELSQSGDGYGDGSVHPARYVGGHADHSAVGQTRNGYAVLGKASIRGIQL